MKEEKANLFIKKVFTFHDTWQERNNTLCLKIHSCNEVIMYAIPPNIKVHLYEDDRHTLMADSIKVGYSFNKSVTFNIRVS
jgi:hypothetical protein